MKNLLLSLCAASALTFSGVSFSNENEALNQKDSALSSQSTTSTEQVIDVININFADIDMLTQLNGVGEKKAKAIVEYRDFYGKFTSTEDLLNVKGIGEKILKQNENRIKL